MGKTALVAEVLWTLAPGDTPPASFRQGIVFYSFYGRPETAIALEQLARSFGEDPLPTPLQAAQRALSGKHALLVLDGAEEAENLEQVLAVCANCAVLVTSRRRSDAADPSLLLDLQGLPFDQAAAVVQAWQGQSKIDTSLIERIVELVGGLPLAVRLAGSYLALHQEDADDYLAWLKEDAFEALNQGSNTRNRVSMLLERSVALLGENAQQALAVVGLFALAPFERQLVAQILELSEEAVGKALGELVNNGLLLRQGQRYEVSHPLIHTYVREVLLTQSEPARQRTLAERLVRVLSTLFPEVVYANWTRCEELLPHVEACAALIEKHRLVVPEAAELLDKGGCYLREQARYAYAEGLLQQALALAEHVPDPASAGLGSVLNNLLLLYLAQGKYAQAIPYGQRALDFDEQALPPDHPEIAITLDNLAQLYHAQGKDTQAEPLYQRALAIKEQALPPDHLSIATTLEHYASLLRQLQRNEEADRLEQRASAIRARRILAT